MKALKSAFNVAALGTGSALFGWSALGFALGGWSTAGQPNVGGGMDFSFLGIGLCLIGAGLFTLGYKGLRKAAKEEARNDGPTPPAP